MAIKKLNRQEIEEAIKVQGSSLDLSGKDLEELDLSNLDLSGSNLSNANMLKTNLTNTNLNGTSLLGTNFEDAILVGTLFTESQYNSETKWPKAFLEAQSKKANQALKDRIEMVCAELNIQTEVLPKIYQVSNRLELTR